MPSLRFVAFVLLFFMRAATARPQSSLPIGTRFVMSHFKADGGGGDERLYISHSLDGQNWTALNNGQPVWQPPNWSGFNNVVRDPAITFANGFYWVAYTSGNYGNHASFGLVKSADLLTWTFVMEVPAGVAGATKQLTWNPVFFEEGDGSIHVFISISPSQAVPYSPIPGMRIHEMHPLDPEWTQWSVPVPVALPSTNQNEFWVWKEGDVYHGLYIDLKQQGSPMVHVISRDLVREWGNAQVLGFHNQEGPMVLPIPEGGYRLYAEGGNSALAAGYRTCDFTSAFASPTTQVPVNATVPMRNGKITAARRTLSFSQWQTQQLGAVPAERRGPLADADDDGLANLLEHAMGADPRVPTLAGEQPEVFGRNLGGERYVGLRFAWLRTSSDVKAFAEVLRAPVPWSRAPSDVFVESIALLSNGTTRVTARTAQPVLFSGAVMLRVTATLQAAGTAAPLSVKPMRPAPPRGAR